MVNHKDENPLNNNVDNLEWCTVSYNNSYNNKGRRSCKNNRPVYQYNEDGTLEHCYFSYRDAAEMLSVSAGALWLCCNDKIHTFHKKVFSRDELTPDEIDERFKKSKWGNVKHTNGREKEVEKCFADGTVLEVYPSALKAAAENGIEKSTMTSWCRKEKFASGYIWRYKNVDLSANG